MMKSSIFLALALAITYVSAWTAEPPFYAQRYTRVAGPRGLLVDETGDVLVVSRGSSNVAVIYEKENAGGAVEVVVEVIIDGSGLNLNHGIAYNNGYLYVSSTVAVYRWPYTPGQRSQVQVDEQLVIRNIPTNGHETRTMVFDVENRLYVSVGSNQNVDPNSDRARIRRFSNLTNLPLEFGTGEVFADGLRNEVGLAFDLKGVLYGVENGADQLNRPDFGDIHNGNPAEEMNRFDQPLGTHYGYPYCFSTYDLQTFDSGTQFAWPSFMNDGVHTDEFCKNISNNRPPVLAMPAHQAPLGIDFYKGQNCDAEGAFPCSMIGDAMVAFHGSWNSDIPVGYKVSWVPFNNATSEPTGVLNDVIIEEDTINCASCFRPVNAVFNSKGHLIISNDATGEIFRVTYGVPPPPVTSA